jgi:hypothetical protein
MNERKVIGGIFCDLVKASDCVNHNILLAKLKFYGVTGTTLKLINTKMILDNNLPNSNSNWGETRHSVLQGSILGSIFFLLYK